MEKMGLGSSFGNFRGESDHESYARCAYYKGKIYQETCKFLFTVQVVIH